MHTIKHLFHIEASKQKVYDAISTIEGLSSWWTVNTYGEPVANGTLTFNFGQPEVKMKISGLEPNEKLALEVTGGNFGWDGHRLTFILDESGGKTRLRFAHEGWQEQNDHYAACNFSWGKYFENLRRYCGTGAAQTQR